MDRDLPDNGFSEDQEDREELAGSFANDTKITNFILQKARNVSENLEDQEQRTQLQRLIGNYEQALKKDDEDLVDETEDALVDFMEDLDDRDEEL